MKPRWSKNALFFPGRVKPRDENLAKTPGGENLAETLAKTGSRHAHTITASDNLLTGRYLTPRRRAALLRKARHA